MPGEPRELTLLVAAAALLLLAAASVLSPRRRAAASGARTRLPAAVRRWCATAALLVAAGGAAVAWTQVPPSLPPPGPAPAGAAAVAAPARPPPPPDFVSITATGRDRTLIRRAVAVLRRHRELADQREAEIKRGNLFRIGGLIISSCDVCKAEPLTGTPTIPTTSSGGTVSCNANLNSFVLRKWRGARTSPPPRWRRC